MVSFNDNRGVNKLDKTITNIYGSKKRTPIYIKKNLTELKREIGNSIVIVGDFIASLSK